VRIAKRDRGEKLGAELYFNLIRVYRTPLPKASESVSLLAGLVGGLLTMPGKRTGMFCLMLIVGAVGTVLAQEQARRRVAEEMAGLEQAAAAADVEGRGTAVDAGDAPQGRRTARRT
jgi:hypothetical protein